MQISFATRLAALYGAIFVVLGIQLPFFPVWLKAKGLDDGMIGVVLATPIVVRVFSVTLAAHVADRRDALRAAIVVTSVASVLANHGERAQLGCGRNRGDLGRAGMGSP